MRIAFVYDLIYPYSKGGVEKRVAEMASRLVVRGHDVTVYGTKMWTGSLTKTVAGVRLQGVDVRAPIFNRAGRRSIRQALIFALRCARMVFHHEYDIVDVQSMSPLACLAVISACRVRRMACMVTWHEVWSAYWDDYLGPLGRIGRLIEWLVGRLGSSHVAVSPSTATKLALIGVHDVDVVPNAVEPSVFTASPGAGAHGGVTYVGRFAVHKNLELLLEAVRHLAARGLEPRVTLVGEGPLLGEITREASALDNVEVVACLEDASDVADLLASSRVFALLSSREGFGLAALEALSCGVPVVTIDSPDNAATDLVRDGQNGFICSASAGKVAWALELILTNDDLHQRLSRNAVESARDYDWDSSIAACELAYQKLLTRRASLLSQPPEARGMPS